MTADDARSPISFVPVSLQIRSIVALALAVPVRTTSAAARTAPETIEIDSSRRIIDPPLIAAQCKLGRERGSSVFR
jgi:hypothetical protein